MQLCRPLDILIRNMSIVSKRQTMKSLIVKLIIHELTDTFQMWFECTNTTKDINIITNRVPYERTFKAHRFTYGAQSGEWYVEFILLACDFLKYLYVGL